jgi:hypothetical protein
MQILDTAGVPEYWSCCTGVVEDASDGNIRIVRCIKRNGVLIPVMSSVMPALSALRDSITVREVAQQVIQGMAVMAGAAN